VPSTTFLEQYEGMLIRFPQTLYVTEHFQLGRFGQVILSSGARLQQPTNVTNPGPPSPCKRRITLIASFSMMTSKIRTPIRSCSGGVACP
jgi:predicted extracellular nuclease